MYLRSTLALLAVAGGVTLAPTAAQAADDTFGCSASAVSGTVLGQAIAPLASAGGSGTCTTSDSSGVLPALLGGGAVTAATRSAGSATSLTDVGDIRVGGLDALTSLLPAAILPEGLTALPVSLPVVPLPTSGLPVGGLPTGPLPTGSLLPSLIKIDALAAARALIGSAQLPDLLSLSRVRSSATASCAHGVPALNGLTQLAGLQVLGQDLGVDRALDQVVPVRAARSIGLDQIDLSKIGLPAGLSFTDPIVGPVLQAAVTSALSALPPIEIPALVGNVKVTPGAQEQTDGGLVQRAARVQVSVLGQDLVDLSLGQAAVSASCGTQAADTVTPASQLAVQCAKRPVTLVDVGERKDHVSLLGAVSAANVGRKVSIVFSKTGKVVSTAVVRPDGFFRATAPLPAAGIRGSNDARYQAVLDGHKSLALKLRRRMRISRMRNLGDTVQIIGKITGPLVPGQQIVIQQRESCTKDVVVKRFTPTKAGVWRVTLKAPTEGQAAVYRATTQVFSSDESEARFPTFTLPGYVSL